MHLDSLLRQLHMILHHQHIDGRFAGAVLGREWGMVFAAGVGCLGDAANGRGHENQTGPVRRFAEEGEECFGGGESANGIDVEDLTESGAGGLGAREDPGVVDEDVEAGEGFLDRDGGAVDGGVGGDVELDRGDGTWMPGEIIGAARGRRWSGFFRVGIPWMSLREAAAASPLARSRLPRMTW